MSAVKIGIIGGGLMGRELASALGRWFVLENFPVAAELTAVCDLAEKQREWFRRVPTVKLLTADHRELLASPDVDVVYVAVPHNLHEALYLDVLNAGKDLLAEKPFGIDLKGGGSDRRGGEIVRPLRAVQLGVSVPARRATGVSARGGGEVRAPARNPLGLSSQQRSRSHQAGELEAPDEDVRARSA